MTLTPEQIAQREELDKRFAILKSVTRHTQHANGTRVRTFRAKRPPPKTELPSLRSPRLGDVRPMPSTQTTPKST